MSAAVPSPEGIRETWARQYQSMLAVLQADMITLRQTISLPGLSDEQKNDFRVSLLNHQELLLHVLLFNPAMTADEADTLLFTGVYPEMARLTEMKPVPTHMASRFRQLNSGKIFIPSLKPEVAERSDIVVVGLSLDEAMSRVAKYHGMFYYMLIEAGCLFTNPV